MIFFVARVRNCCNVVHMTTDKHQNQAITIGIRLTRDQRRAINVIAERQCNTASGIIRLAIQQLLANEESAVNALQNHNTQPNEETK